VKRGALVQVPVDLHVKSGLHINSHQPEDKYLIALRVTWDNTLAEALATEFPKPIQRTFEFSGEKSLSVFEGKLQLKQNFQVKPNATRGFGSITGKVTYQACSESECYPPASAPVRITVDIR